MIAPYASPRIRDQFLAALDADDRALSTQLALNLTDCTNPLPGMTCDQLGLPIGSTYGSAARRVLSLNAIPQAGPASAPDAAMSTAAPGQPGKPAPDV